MITFTIFIISMILIGANLEKFRYKHAISKDKLILIVIITGVVTVFILDGILFDMNKDYFRKQWYYYIIYGKSSDGSTETLSIAPLFIGGIIILITYQIRFKIDGILNKRSKTKEEKDQGR